MRKSKLIVTVLLGYAWCLFMRCSTVGPNAGGASDTEVSAKIAGTVTDIKGSAVAGAEVQLRLKDYLPGSRMAKKHLTLYTEGEAVTDANGYFLIDSIEKGSYILSINSGDTAGIVEECNVTKTEEFDLSAVIKPFGMAVGWIDLSYRKPGTASKIKIEVLGSEKMTRPDSTGFFQIVLPEGFHWLRISTDSSYFDELTINVFIIPSQVRNIGVLRLDFIPFSSCMDHRCDSMVLRKFLDEAGHADILVDDVATWDHARIAGLNFRDIPLSVSLAPLGQLNTVREIDLGNTGTADSCWFVHGLWNLQVLYLDNNALTGLYPGIGGVSWLRKLDISGNNLADLPESIIYLSPISGLNLSGNSLCDLSPAITDWIDTWADVGWRDTQECP